MGINMETCLQIYPRMDKLENNANTFDNCLGISFYEALGRCATWLDQIERPSYNGWSGYNSHPSVHVLGERIESASGHSGWECVRRTNGSNSSTESNVRSDDRRNLNIGARLISRTIPSTNNKGNNEAQRLTSNNRGNK